MFVIAGIALLIAVSIAGFNRYELYQARKAGWEFVKSERGLQVTVGDEQYLTFMRNRMPSHQPIIELHMHGRPTDNKWAFMLAQSEISMLTLNGCQVSPEQIESLRQLPQLKQLSIRSCQLEKNDIKAIAKLQGLETLELNEQRLNSEEVQELVKLYSLRHLMVREINDFQCLSQLHNLVSLEYWEDELTIPDKFLDTLLKLPQLKRLTIRKRRDLGSPSFDILAKCERLEFPDLRTSKISRDGLQQFQDTRPDVLLLFDAELVYEPKVVEPDPIPQEYDSLELDVPKPESFEYETEIGSKFPEPGI
jgi:hypothetical protein